MTLAGDWRHKHVISGKWYHQPGDMVILFPVPDPAGAGVDEDVAEQVVVVLAAVVAVTAVVEQGPDALAGREESSWARIPR